MSAYRIAYRYAKSLIELSKEKQLLEEVHRDMKLIDETFKHNKELDWVIKNPVIKSTRKGSILKALFEGKVSKLTSMFIATVSKKEREKFLRLISQAFIKQYNELNGIAQVTITSASDLSTPMMGMVKEFVEKETKSKADIKYQVDPSLIGGVVIRMEDQLYDFSIAKQLKQLRKEMVSK